MSIIVEGGAASFGLLIVFIVIITIRILQGYQGKEFVLKRNLEALDMIPEAIGRAVEMGRPVHYTPGSESTTGGRGTQTWMGIVIGGFVTKICARLGADIMWSVRAEHLPMVTEIYREAFLSEGIKDIEPDVRYYGAFALGCIESIANDDVAVNIMFGGFGSELPQIAEAASRLGCFQIAGSSNPPMVPLVVASCEYSLIGEENFVAGAVLSENNVQLGSIVGLDFIKIGLVCLIVLGSLLNTANIPMLMNMLGG